MRRDTEEMPVLYRTARVACSYLSQDERRVLGATRDKTATVGSEGDVSRCAFPGEENGTGAAHWPTQNFNCSRSQRGTERVSRDSGVWFRGWRCERSEPRALIPCRRDVTRLRRSSGARQEGLKIAAHAGQVPNRGLEASAPRSFVSGSSAARRSLAIVAANVTHDEAGGNTTAGEDPVVFFVGLQARIRLTHRAVTGLGFTAGVKAVAFDSAAISRSGDAELRVPMDHCHRLASRDV
ncbi:hypothetical protein HPB50_015610 [Hyalomma asiaticum]|uniref:Uncharacterized protein n=1 Tax=Hyalomma asiaticum TaxID=266040 RepID=A0ACB7T0V2_HYAAI|nr:hypothetical protein HPB50_015610 [Hyalomma asiaticum]